MLETPASSEPPEPPKPPTSPAKPLIDTPKNGLFGRLITLLRPKSGSGGSTKRSEVPLAVTSSCQGPGNHTKSKEDRIITIDDLQTYLLTNKNGLRRLGKAQRRSSGLSGSSGNNPAVLPVEALVNWPDAEIYSGSDQSQNASQSKEDLLLSESRNEELHKTATRWQSSDDEDAFVDASSSRNQIPTGSSDVAQENVPNALEHQNSTTSTTSKQSDVKESGSPIPPRSRLQIKLYAVFDGHCGSYASSFFQVHFPLHLYNAPSFVKGDFSVALREAYESVHAALLEDNGYFPEAPSNDFSSGATATVILVTKDRTYFAFLGDSPILIWKRNSQTPELLFKEMDIDNPLLHDYIVDSNIFLVGIREQGKKHEYRIITDPKAKRSALKENAYSNDFLTQSTLRGSTRRKIYGENKFDDVRVGMSALNVWGTLGDSIYDVNVFNTFLKEVNEYKTARNLVKGQHFDYVDFRHWMMSRPIWSTYLGKHLSLLPQESQMSRVFLTAVRELTYPEHTLKQPGLLRVPHIKVLNNSDLKLFVAASDGVIRFYDRFRADYDAVIIRWGEKNPGKCVDELKKFLIWIGDDRSVVLGNYLDLSGGKDDKRRK